MVKQLIGIQVHYIRFPGGSSNRISKNYCHGIMSQLTREVIKQGYQYYELMAAEMTVPAEFYYCVRPC